MCVIGMASCPAWRRVVGIAGGEQKCRWLKEELGFDEVIGTLYLTSIPPLPYNPFVSALLAQYVLASHRVCVIGKSCGPRTIVFGATL